jgi:hypothetical protein
MNFREMWPRSTSARKRFGRIVLAVTIFRELTGLNGFLGYTQREEIGRGWDAGLRYRVLRRSR